ncbi:MAG: amidohydrolase family protein [Gemmatimonadetes bacterium]|nr:amidohydrolase family protein [Gemmatimonadota bacterium]
MTILHVLRGRTALHLARTVSALGARRPGARFPRALALGALLLGAPTARAQDKAVAIRGGTVLPISGPAIPNGTVVMRGGKIVAVGANVSIPAGAEIVDARGKYVMPGVIDAATQIGLEATDQNEASDPVTPGLRAFESWNPFGTFGGGKPGPLRNKELLAGGVTTMYPSPADATIIGGQGFIAKNAGPNVEAMLVREIAAMDMTLGTPPKSAARARNRDPYTRMAEVAMIRAALIKAQEYVRNRAANPSLPRDLGNEALGKLLAREMPARIQANSATDIRSALRLAEEFNLQLIIDGGAAAYEFRDELARRKVPVVLGQVSHPYVSNEEIPDKQDYPPVDERLAGRLTAAGVTTAIASFARAFGTLAPAVSGKWLLLDASIAAGYGMADADVLKAVTLVPATILGIADRVGSLEVGKDADVIVLDGNPLSVKTWVERAYVNGELVHQR